MEADTFDDDDELDDAVLCSLPLEHPYPAGEGVTVATPPVVGTGVSYTTDDAADCEGDATASTSASHITTEVTIPLDFPFPFEPYPIQVGFMQQLYRTLEEGKVGIFESPTGTGKSLSLICGALKWLNDYEEKKKRELEEMLVSDKLASEKSTEEPCTQDDSGLDWISAYAKQKENEDRAKELQAEQELKKKRLEHLQNVKNVNQQTKRKRSKLEDQFDELFTNLPSDIKKQIDEADSLENDPVVDDEDDDAALVVAEYHSDDEQQQEGDGEDKKEEEPHVTKIYYCSRTHSQLSQFIHEIQKSPYADNTRAISLGSRQNMCINDNVQKLKSLSLMNDRCIELQKNKSKATKKDTDDTTKKKKKISNGCPYYKQEKMSACRDKALVEIKDIEQLVELGKKSKACPYYSSRYAVPSAEVVALPYQTLLHKSTRESCGIKLKGNIVIIDEAHNLLDTISAVHSVQITGAQVTYAYSQLQQYMHRYQSRLKAKNLMYIKQLMFILNAFIKLLGGTCGERPDQQKTNQKGSKLQTINDFLFETHLDNINLFKISRYCDNSLIARKLHGFVEKYQPKIVDSNVQSKKTPPTWALSNFLKEISQNRENCSKSKASPTPPSTTHKDDDAAAASGADAVMMSSPLMVIQNFISALTNADQDGRILIDHKDLLSQSTMRFLLLNPAVYFTEVVTEPRAVIVAGGTMQPLSDFKEQLFHSAGIMTDRIIEYSCGHVIPEEQLLPIAVAHGPSGTELDFTYHNRLEPHMMTELGRVVYNVCNVVPGGVVLFFPSYEYEKLVYAHWDAHGFLEKISARKKIFREPKKSGVVDAILADYTSYIEKSKNPYKHNGAILLSVVGGKMSEGINFSDDLGRCIIMVGLPYPNMKSPELKEKMDYLNKNMEKAANGKLPGQVHYENLCMKAVNQSIGRAIRHKDDYATILLLDHRYLKPTIQAKLPGWIQKSLLPVTHFGPAVGSVAKFFARKD